MARRGRGGSLSEAINLLAMLASPLKYIYTFQKGIAVCDDCFG